MFPAPLMVGTNPSLRSMPAARPPRRQGKLMKRLSIALGLMLFLGLAYIILAPGENGPDVLTATATRGDLVITVTDRGELESAKEIKILCEVEGGGKVATIVPEGTRVKATEQIATLDTDLLQKSINEQEIKWEQADGKLRAATTDLDVETNKGEGEVAKAENALAVARIDFDSYEVGEYQVEVEKRKASLELARKELKEAEDGLLFKREMVKKGFSPEEQLRSTELNLDSKRAKVREQEADLMVLEMYTKKKRLTELQGKLDDAIRECDRAKTSLKNTVAKCESEISAAQKTATLEKRELERLRQQIDKCVIKAPQDGIVIYAKRHYWDEGSEIRPGATLHYQQPIVVLPDLNEMQVKMRVHESVVKKVKRDQTATMLVDALPGQVLHGRVINVATQAQSQGWRSTVKEYETTVTVDDLPHDAGLRPGMTAEVKIQLKTIHNALTVPVQAVSEFDDAHVAYVLNGYTIERRKVKIGDSNDTLVEIIEGIQEGERVVLDARNRVAKELKTSEGKPDAEKNSEPGTESKPASSEYVSTSSE